jgi:hypothetical protein
VYCRSSSAGSSVLRALLPMAPSPAPVFLEQRTLLAGSTEALMARESPQWQVRRGLGSVVAPLHSLVEAFGSRGAVGSLCIHHQTPLAIIITPFIFLHGAHPFSARERSSRSELTPLRLVLTPGSVPAFPPLRHLRRPTNKRHPSLLLTLQRRCCREGGRDRDRYLGGGVCRCLQEALPAKLMREC